MIPRPEYPRPQFIRDKYWLNLNGKWEFVFGKSLADFAIDSEKEPTKFDREIMVPFCPESRLSGIEYTDFIEVCAYRREFEIPKNWFGRKTVIHFGGVDYRCRLFIDGIESGNHLGGACGFAFELNLSPGKHSCTVLVIDELQSGKQGGGKQSHDLESAGCFYSRITGIWQTVWLESIPAGGLKKCHILSDPDTGKVVFTPEFYSDAKANDRLRISIIAEEMEIDRQSFLAVSGIPVTFVIPDVRQWNPDNPFLYEVKYEIIRNDLVVDHVWSYFGMRKIECRGDQIYLNGEPFFLRMVLDQGYYPEGLWTAPSDAALKRDVELALELGFNGIRLHQKVSEDRYLYWADQLGLLVWAEFPSWGMNLNDYEAKFNFLHEWRERVIRDLNHPSIIAWGPMNESYLYPSPDNIAKSIPDTNTLRRYREFMREIYALTHVLDSSRPVCDASGWIQTQTDLWSEHLYRNSADALKQALDKPEYGGKWSPYTVPPHKATPLMVNEWGGFRYRPEGDNDNNKSWGYGDEINSDAEFLDKISEQLDVLLGHPSVRGYCYTQLYDVEQEKNGLLRADRSSKLPLEQYKKLFGRTQTHFVN